MQVVWVCSTESVELFLKGLVHQVSYFQSGLRLQLLLINFSVGNCVPDN